MPPFNPFEHQSLLGRFHQLQPLYQLPVVANISRASHLLDHTGKNQIMCESDYHLFGEPNWPINLSALLIPRPGQAREAQGWAEFRPV